MSRLVMFCVVALAVFMVVTQPEGAAGLVTTLLGHLHSAAQALTQFLISLGGSTSGAVG